MSENTEKIFADGFSFKKRDNQPEFVVGKVAIKVEDAIPFLKENESKGWVNLNINQARSGKYYLELDTWKPKAQEENQPEEKAKEDLPF